MIGGGVAVHHVGKGESKADVIRREMARISDADAVSAALGDVELLTRKGATDDDPRLRRRRRRRHHPALRFSWTTR